MRIWDEIRRRLSFREVVARTHTIGRDNKVLCPFHVETTPSCHIYDDHFYCFGCGKHGDVFDWVMHVGGLTAAAALERLAKEAGVDLSNGWKQEYNKYRDLTAAVERWHQTLLRDEAALAYLKSRQISEQLIREYRLGLYDTGQIVLPVTDRYGHFIGWQFHNYTEELRRAAGQRLHGASATLERLESPIECPICGAQVSELVRGASVCEACWYLMMGPKYETRHTPFFRRADVVWGLAQALRRDRDEVWLVEGPYDAMSLAAINIAAVAHMGLLSPSQVTSVVQCFRDARVVLCPDTSEEGIEKGLRNAAVLRKEWSGSAAVCILPAKDANEAAIHNLLADAVLETIGLDAWRADYALRAERQQAEKLLKRIYVESPLPSRPEIEQLVSKHWEIPSNVVRNLLLEKGDTAVPLYTGSDAWLGLEELLGAAALSSRAKLGFPQLDEVIELIPGKVAQIVGRAGIGKTAIMVQLLLNLLSIGNPPAAVVVGFEPSPADIMMRVVLNLAARMGYVDMTSPKSPMVALAGLRSSEEHWTVLNQLAMDYFQPNVCFLHGPMAVKDLRAAVHSAEANTLGRKADYVLVDYLELARMKDDYAGVMETVKAVQQVAAELGAFFVVLRQVPRNIARSRVADVGEAGAFFGGEAQVDYEVTLRRRWPVPGQPLNIIAKVTKNRYGPEWPLAPAQLMLYYPHCYVVEPGPLPVDVETEGQYLREDLRLERQARGEGRKKDE